ncbi:uncharacterized protein LOC101848342 [Aplysia californica]|uniref:Uncharacterized protein LOC101848342 n=1 Tax=Aplysia californica TaxID=6500 RepID=A0ABM0ZWR3_APLCA|nr:uncharacterized protein LOC101848342 [Aplysia californica]
MVLLGIFPAVSAMYFDWKFFPDRNMTLIGLKFHAGGGETKLVSFSLNVISLLFSFLLVVVCTAILVYKLISKTKWRQEMSGAAPDVKQTSVSRDQKVVKMVVFISAVYIGCFFWSAVSMIISMLVPGYSVVGPNKNMFQTVWSFLLLLEGTNSSVNMFIYLKMSSKFRKVFTETFSFRRQNSVKTR